MTETARQPRRMVQRLGLHPVELLQARSRVGRVSVSTPTFAKHLAVESLEPVAESHVKIRMGEITVLGPAQVVRGPVLVDEPDDLIWVAGIVRWELRADDEIHWPVVTLAEIKQPPCRRVRQNFFLRVPLKRNTDDRRVIPVRLEVADQFAHVGLGTTGHKRHLGFAHENCSHRHPLRSSVPARVFALIGRREDTRTAKQLAKYIEPHYVRRRPTRLQIRIAPPRGGAAPPAPHDFFEQFSARRSMSAVQGNTERGGGLGGSLEGDRSGLRLAGARRHGAVVCAPEGVRGHRAPHGGIARAPQSPPRGDGREALAVA